MLQSLPLPLPAFLKYWMGLCICILLQYIGILIQWSWPWLQPDRDVRIYKEFHVPVETFKYVQERCTKPHHCNVLQMVFSVQITCKHVASLPWIWHVQPWKRSLLHWPWLRWCGHLCMIIPSSLCWNVVHGEKYIWWWICFIQMQTKQGFGTMGSHKLCVRNHLGQAVWPHCEKIWIPVQWKSSSTYLYLETQKDGYMLVNSDVFI